MKKYDFDKVIDRAGTGAIKYDMVEMLFGQEDVLPMWVADMDFEVPDFIVDAIKERAGHPVYGYTRRTESFFEAVSGWMKKRHSWNVSPGDVDFSPGIVPALVLSVLAYTNPGDRILVQSPVYFPFFSSIENHGRALVNNQLSDDHGNYTMDFDDLESKFRDGVKMMMFCHPHNPVGRAWSGEELEKLAELAVKYDVLVVSDEIHSDLLLFGNKHIPLATLDRKIARRTITCVAPSKTFNLAGLHTSALVIEDKQLMKRYKKVLGDTHIGGGNLFGFTALEVAYQSGEEWLTQLLNYLEQNFLLLRQRVNEAFPQVRISPLEATYLVWLNFEFLGLDDKELFRFMTEKARLGFVDGPRFGSGGEGYMRMNIAAPRSVINEALDRLLHALGSLS
ncbi:MAG: PatB family C-S lyase [Bacteroidales bacterium]|nr:PatB family C-S lyase [Bacteroidales bacterium]